MIHDSSKVAKVLLSIRDACVLCIIISDFYIITFPVIVEARVVPYLNLQPRASTIPLPIVVPASQDWSVAPTLQT